MLNNLPIWHLLVLTSLVNIELSHRKKTFTNFSQWLKKTFHGTFWLKDMVTKGSQSPPQPTKNIKTHMLILKLEFSKPKERLQYELDNDGSWPCSHFQKMCWQSNSVILEETKPTQRVMLWLQVVSSLWRVLFLLDFV